MKKIALIGAGGIGGVWAAAIHKTRGVKLCAAVDPNIKRARALADMFAGCEAYAQPEEVFKNKNIDAVIVAVPHNLLAPLSFSALFADKHVLCEKPGGLTAKMVQKNLRLASKKRLVYMIGFNHRYHAAYLQAEKECKKGTIGDVLYLRARYGFGGRPGYNKEWRFNKKISGGGELIDQGIHMLDIARLFLGEITEASGFTPNYYWGGEVEDNAFVLARTKAGKVAHIHASWTNWDWVHSVEIFGTKGYVRIDGLDNRYHGPERLTIGTHNPQAGTFPKEKVIEFANERKEDSFARELQLFLRAIDGEKVIYPNGTDAIQALALVEKIYKDNKKR